MSFPSIRMEPAWMALVQAAGVAADLAIKHNTNLHDVPIQELQRSLIEQGQIVHHSNN